MSTLRKRVFPSLLALLLLSSTACDSESARAGTPPGVVTISPGSCTAPRSSSPNAEGPRLETAGEVDPRAVLEDFRRRGMVGHLEALQRIADDNGGNRASGTSGYEESARYVEEQLCAAGYNPVRQTFTVEDHHSNRNRTESFNILAETGGSAANTVVVGGHLDSVEDGPGINDNGSGVAAVLETAKWMKENRTDPVNRVVFAFWGAEENDLDGSWNYVEELSRTEKNQTSAYLNVDMAASPNGIRAFHDADRSDFGDAGPEGSKEIEDAFSRFFEANSLPAETTPFEAGDSDYDAFVRAGIPVGGLFSGDVEKKSDAQAQAYGGTPGRNHDPCYHEACDTLSNIDSTLLQEMSGAMAYVTADYALAPRN